SLFSVGATHWRFTAAAEGDGVVVAGGGVVLVPASAGGAGSAAAELPPEVPLPALEAPEFVLDANPALELPLSPPQPAIVSAPIAIIPTKTIRTDPNFCLALVMQPPSCTTPKITDRLGAKSSTWELRVRVRTCDPLSLTGKRVRASSRQLRCRGRRACRPEVLRPRLSTGLP